MPICSNCGKEIEDEQKVCAHCGEAVKISKSNKIFVPIDFSNVGEAIPPGEDIIYSAFCSVQRSGVERGGYQSENFQTHVLITKNGIAYQEPIGGLIKSNYIPWHELANVGMGQIVFNKGKGTKIKTYNCTMTPVSKFESLQDFEMRSRKFYFDFTPYLIEEKKKHKSKAKKVQKVYDNLKAILGRKNLNFLELMMIMKNSINIFLH
jgi:hypothetical protein